MVTRLPVTKALAPFCTWTRDPILVALEEEVASEVKPPTWEVVTELPKEISPAVDLAFTLPAETDPAIEILPAAFRLTLPVLLTLVPVVAAILIAEAVTLVVVIDKLPEVAEKFPPRATVPVPWLMVKLLAPGVTIPILRLPEVLVIAMLPVGLRALPKLMLPEPVVTSPADARVVAAMKTAPAEEVISPAAEIVRPLLERFKFTKPVPLALITPFTLEV